MNIKSTLVTILQFLGAMLAFAISLMIPEFISPLSPEIADAGKTASGFLPTGAAFAFNAAANAVVLVWAARRSSYKGLALYGQLLAHAILPTAQLSFANPLMPAAVSLGHFWEVLISTGIFGALCAWFVPQPVPARQ